jgi:hypothetical protein
MTAVPHMLNAEQLSWALTTLVRSLPLKTSTVHAHYFGRIRLWQEVPKGVPNRTWALGLAKQKNGEGPKDLTEITSWQKNASKKIKQHQSTLYSESGLVHVERALPFL